MAVQLICPQCEKEVVLAYLKAGDEFKCPHCSLRGVVPEPGNSFVRILSRGGEPVPAAAKAESSVGQADVTAMPAGPALVGIGGWLVLPAIGLVLGPVIGVVLLIISLGYASDVAEAGYGAVFALEMLVQIGLLGLLIYAATRFFAKKSDAPNMMIAFLLVSLVASFVLCMIEMAAEAEVFAIESGKQIARNVVTSAIWVPYFRGSKRVKATFVN